MSYYYDKSKDIVCFFDGNKINFGKERKYKCLLKENGITVEMWEFLYHFYPNIEHPKIGQIEDIHMYPIEDSKISHINDVFIVIDKIETNQLLKDAYILISKLISEEHNNEIFSESTIILKHIYEKLDDKEVEKVEDIIKRI